ncbi:unnamed protein product, partial [Mesorhabditis spiculigera]
MNSLIICTLAVFGLVYGRPATNEEAQVEALGKIKMDINDLFSDDLLKLFTPELNEFTTSLTLLDASSFLALAGQKDQFKTVKDVMDALKETNEDTYDKVQKLVTAYKKRYAELTPGAKKILEESHFSGLCTKDLTTLSDAEGHEMVNKFREALGKASDADKKSIEKQLPLLYKLVNEPEILKKAQSELKKKGKAYVAKIAKQQQDIASAA